MRNSFSLQMHPIRSSWIPLYCRHLEHVYSVSVLKKSQSLHWTGLDCTCPVRKDTVWEIFAKASLKCARKESVKITGRCRAKTRITICPFSDAFLRGIRSFYNPNPEQPLPAERSSLSPRGLTQGAPRGTSRFWSSSASASGAGQRSRIARLPSQPGNSGAHGHRTQSPACSATCPACPGSAAERSLTVSSRPHSRTRCRGSSAGNMCQARMWLHPQRYQTAGYSNEHKDSFAH